MPERVRWLALFLFLSGAAADAEEPTVFLNIGLKMGYTFGPTGGFTMGPEASLTAWTESFPRFAPGFVVGTYSCAGRVVFYCGPQVTGPASVGFGASLAVIREDGATDVGLRTEVFGLLFLMPEYGHVFRWQGHEGLDELGMYLKLPVRVSGPFFSLGG
jgi:hypothetical protein